MDWISIASLIMQAMQNSKSQGGNNAPMATPPVALGEKPMMQQPLGSMQQPPMMQQSMMPYNQQKPWFLSQMLGNR